MNWSLGFGLERLGLLALRFPRLATIILLVSLVMAASTIPRLGFDGNVVNVLDPQSRAFQNFILQATSFHDFSGDVAVVVEHDDFTSPAVFEGLRDLHLDLALDEGVRAVFSVFTLGETAADGSDAPLLPFEFDSRQEVEDALEKLLEREPQAASIMKVERGAMLMLVSLESAAHRSESALDERLTKLRQSFADYAPPGTSIAFSGMPQIRLSIVQAIIQDQTVLTAAGILLGCFVAWLIFRTLMAALVCSAPAFVAVLWVLCAFSTSQTPLNFFTTALPTLSLIIAFADTIVLYFRWQSLNIEGDGREARLDNLARSIRQVGPASALTSITTALAFASFAWADSPTMDQLALFGIISVMSAFAAVMLALPVAAHWATRLGPEKSVHRLPRLAGRGGKVSGVTTKAPLATAVTAIAMVGLFAVAHFQIRPSYAITDYLPHGSEIRASEAFVDENFGGTSQVYVLLEVTEGGTFDDAENRRRLIAVDEAVAAVFGSERTLSLAAAWQRLDGSAAGDLAAQLEEAGEALRGRFVSDDRRILQVSAAIPSGVSTLDTEAKIEHLRERLDRNGLGAETRITGLSVLLATEFPSLIEQLRTGLVVSIFLSVFVIALATRNLPLAFASLVPNLVPILFTETVMWLAGASLSVTNIIALTIAFGIAIDNAVHVINAWSAREGLGEESALRVRNAVGEIAPALLASTGIICIAASITQLSSMPSVAELGYLLIATLFVALLANLAILPSMMIVILDLKKHLSGKTAP